MMARFFSLTMVCALISQLAFSQTKLSGPYTLHVDVKTLQSKPGKLYFQYYNSLAMERVSDSAEVNGDEVVFKGKIEEPVFVTLRYTPKPVEGQKPVPVMMGGKTFFSFYLEPGKVNIVVNDSMSNSTVSGSKSHEDYLKLEKLKEGYQAKIKQLYADYSAFYKAKDTVSAKKILEEVNAINDEIKEKVYKPYILENGNKTPIALMALNRYAGYDINYEKVEPLFNKISPTYRNLPSGVSLKEKLETAKKTGIGAMAMDFTQNDTLDKPVSLSSFRGKYVLLDFWASWCGPCRAENPNLVKTFNRFKDKGFTILGVSLDQPGQKEKWMKAIHDDKLTWTHVSDLAYWKNAVAKLYAVNAVPQNYLIDPNGKIVAKNLRGEELDKKLDEIFAGK